MITDLDFALNNMAQDTIFEFLGFQVTWNEVKGQSWKH